MRKDEKMKRVLILGKNSYLGESLYKWLLKYPAMYEVNIVSTLDNAWKEADFAKYDTVVDYAGIAHINHITEDMRELFYTVNRDLTVDIGKWCRKYGVKQLIYFSSMNVYGDYCNNISDRSAVNPTSFYGDSKLQGDIGLEKLESESFKVAHVRPPFVYGKNCTGNYKSISKIAKSIPVFPEYHNKKSMIYIDNLSEFIRLLIDSGKGGIYTPQNRELVSTTDLVREIAKVSGNRIFFTTIFNPCITIGTSLSKKIRRAFANDCYAIELSDHFKWKYAVVSFEESIRITEAKERYIHGTDKSFECSR